MPQTPLLFTPGPLMTSERVKTAMLRDWGPRDPDFAALEASIRARLVDLAGGTGSHVAVPMSGSGNLAVEAMVGSFVPREGKLLILINGVYGRRAIAMCDYAGRAYATFEMPFDTAPDPIEIDTRLAADPGISHVLLVDCETTTGILNPLHAIAGVVAARGRGLLVDSMCGFGALPIDVRTSPVDALAASPTKCLESVPGLCFVIVRESALRKCQGNAPAVNLDLYDQWRSLEQDGCWRFTAPTHVVAALGAALDELEVEGGIAGRMRRYARTSRSIIDGFRAMGFETVLDSERQAPMIVSFRAPCARRFDLDRFHAGLLREGVLISPGKLDDVPSFRVACMGQVGEAEVRYLLAAVQQTITAMGIERCAKR